jgi:hypothetical protein
MIIRYRYQIVMRRNHGDVDMELTISRRDVALSVMLLAAFGAWVVYALQDNRQMQRELEAKAEEHIDAWFNGYGKPIDRADFDYLAIVDSEKAFSLFGRGWGVVHVYVKDKADVDFKTFKGLEYFYMRESGEWKMQDSAGCGAHEHHLRAFDAFMKQGVDVPNKVYNRALGVDVAGELEHLDAGQAAKHNS